MDKTNITRLIEQIEQTEHYDQGQFGIANVHMEKGTNEDSIVNCQTPCCLAGHAAWLAWQDARDNKDIHRLRKPSSRNMSQTQPCDS